MSNVKFYLGEDIPLELHKVRMVQKLYLVPIERRLEAIKDAGFNTFRLSTKDVYLDMLTDSGTNAMSDNQISAMLRADDAYAGSQSFERLQEAVEEVLGKKYLLPVHQGRAAENVISRTFIKPGNVIPMNYHFTTALAHILENGGKVAELLHDEALILHSENPFKGNMDIAKLEACIQENGVENIPFIRMEASTNLIGGQPFSISNLMDVRRVADKYGIMLVLDASLLGENAYLVKQREEQWKENSMADIITLRSFCEDSGQRDVNMEKLRRMEEYAESRVCRRRILLNYFGETSSCNCGNCDVCKNPPRTFDGTIRAQKALSAVVRSGEHIAVGTCIEILRGMHSSAVVKNKYNEMKTFGVGRDTTSKDWNAYLLQMLQMGFFEIAYNNHNYMKVTDLGWKVLKGEHHVSLAYIEEDDKATRPQKTVRNRKGAIAQPGNLIPEVHAERVIFQEDSKGVEDKGLFEHLRKIRKNLADEQGYPPYIVLSDKSLHELARMKPTTKNAMSLISGIGEFKLNKYGDTFIKAIRKYTGL